MKRGIEIFNIVYGLIVALFLLDNLTNFDIKNQFIKTLAYFGLLIGTPLSLILNLMLTTTLKKMKIWVAIPVAVLVLIIVIGPMKIVFSVGVWKTQTILYQSQDLSFKTVEFQMQDIGARGYNDRTVEVIYLTPLFIVINPAPNNIDEKNEWIRVDREINELGIKYP